MTEHLTGIMNDKKDDRDVDRELKLAQAHHRSNNDVKVIDKYEKRRRQNLLNQRAARWRKQQEKAKAPSKQPSYRVYRWRIDEPACDVLSPCERIIPITTNVAIRSQSPEGPSNLGDSALINNYTQDVCSFDVLAGVDICEPYPDISLCTPLLDKYAKIPSISEHFNFPLSSDHILIQLIHHNTFRALITNKEILRENTSLIKPYPQPQSVFYSNTDFCDGFTIIRTLPTAQLPDTLQPTQSQMSVAHSSWMNMIPFPRFRDNLIRESKYSAVGHLCLDLFGDIYPGLNQRKSEWCDFSSSSISPKAGDDDEYNDDISAGRKCLIVWGNPWAVENWEATPGFVKKWGWVMEGCHDLIASSNRWRATRNEEPLRV